MRFYEAREVRVGNVVIGGNRPVVLQSMTNTPTEDVASTVHQAIDIFLAGGEIVRITVRNAKEVESLRQIKQELIQRGYTFPVVADIHFNPELAYQTATFVEKVRVNPGNFFVLKPKNELYSDSEYQLELQEIEEKFIKLLDICKEHGTAIRIGINSGSLPRRVLQHYGHTPEAMVVAALEFIDIASRNGFHDLIISLKGTDIAFTIDANRLLASRFKMLGYDYPIHLGITEAGSDIEGVIKSTIGIGTLLAEGIGHTIRVSLTGPPEKELSVAKKIVEFAQLNAIDHSTLSSYWEIPVPVNLPEPQVVFEKSADIPLVSNLTEVRNLLLQKKFDVQLDENVDDDVFLSLLLGEALLKHPLKKIYTPRSDLAELFTLLFQLTKRKITQADFISCPSCGRTTFDIERLSKEVKETFRHYRGLTIAVMGCVVNGPGEIAHADYGILGAKPGFVHIYANGIPILKNIPENDAVRRLKAIIDQKED